MATAVNCWTIRSRRSRRSTLPDEVRGSAAGNSMCLGITLDQLNAFAEGSLARFKRPASSCSGRRRCPGA